MLRRSVVLFAVTLLLVCTAPGRTQDKATPRLSPEKMKAALATADTVFVGKVAEADLSDGNFPGYYGIQAKRVRYEVTDHLKGKAPKTVELWLLLQPLETPEYLDPQGGPKAAPKLDAKLFARGSTHVVYCLAEKNAVEPWKTSIGFVYGAGKPGDRVFCLNVTSDVAGARAAAKQEQEGK